MYMSVQVGAILFPQADGDGDGEKKDARSLNDRLSLSPTS